MMHKSVLMNFYAVAILLFQTGCVSERVLSPDDLPDDISMEELRGEMRSTNLVRYGVGGAVLTGALGLIAGGVIGYNFDRQVYCNEDCGTVGGVFGSLLGLGAGLILGGKYFSRKGAQKDRQEAVERIRQRRDLENSSLKIRLLSMLSHVE